MKNSEPQFPTLEAHLRLIAHLDQVERELDLFKKVVVRDPNYKIKVDNNTIRVLKAVPKKKNYVYDSVCVFCVTYTVLTIFWGMQ